MLKQYCLLQVQALNATEPTTTMSTNMTNSTMDHHNMTSGNATQDKSAAGGRTEMSLVLLPVALGFLYGCS